MKELHSSAEQLSREKIKYEVDKEVEEESIVNRLQRQIESLIQNYKVSSKLQGELYEHENHLFGNVPPVPAPC